MKPCIVYLAQNTEKDPHYGRDSKSMLQKSLDLLYQNYNEQFRHDIIIFHEGDFDDESQEEVRHGREEIRFYEVKFALPDFLNADEVPEKWDGIFGLGYRHMIRFFSLTIFTLIKELGYDWFMRMDDDSFLHSRINYNLFDFMSKNGYEYGYRVVCKEPERTAHGFSEMVLAYLKAERLKAPGFLSQFDNSARLNTESFGFKGWVKQKLVTQIDRLSTRLNHDLNNWPAPSEWNRQAVYTNFFITRVDFWLQPKVQSFLNHVDRLGGGYKYRWGDAIVHTAAIQMFLESEQIHQFDDWTYEHATIKNGKLDWGGIYPGKSDEQNPAVVAFRKQFGLTQTG